jgi:hypothetical protein
VKNLNHAVEVKILNFPSCFITLPITNAAWVRAQLWKLQKGYTRLAAASGKVYQLLAQCRWFSPGTHAIIEKQTKIEFL